MHKRTRMQNRLRWHLVELCPELEASFAYSPNPLRRADDHHQRTFVPCLTQKIAEGTTRKEAIRCLKPSGQVGSDAFVAEAEVDERALDWPRELLAGEGDCGRDEGAAVGRVVDPEFAAQRRSDRTAQCLQRGTASALLRLAARTAPPSGG
jgi:hypothetical protein